MKKKVLQESKEEKIFFKCEWCWCMFESDEYAIDIVTDNKSEWMWIDKEDYALVRTKVSYDVAIEKCLNCRRLIRKRISEENIISKTSDYKKEEKKKWFFEKIASEERWPWY